MLLIKNTLQTNVYKYLDFIKESMCTDNRNNHRRLIIYICEILLNFFPFYK